MYAVIPDNELAATGALVAGNARNGADAELLWNALGVRRQDLVAARSQLRNSPKPEENHVQSPQNTLDQQEKNAVDTELTIGQEIGDLLTWAANHTDQDVRGDAVNVRTTLQALHARRLSDAEVAATTAEVAELERRLATLRSRLDELQPQPTTKKVRTRDHDPKVVRAWAKATGVDCPGAGVVPRRVVSAWREATSGVTELRAVS